MNKKFLIFKLFHKRKNNFGATLVEFALVFPIFILLLLFIIDLVRYALVYGGLLLAAHEAADLASKLQVELVTTKALCQNQAASGGVTNCQRYENILNTILAKAEERARIVASSEADSWVRLSRFNMYGDPVYQEQECPDGRPLFNSGINPNGIVAFAAFHRPGEVVIKCDSVNQQECNINTGIRVEHPTRPSGAIADTQCQFGNGWPERGESWGRILSDIPVSISLSAVVRPVTPFIPSLNVSARQQAFRLTGIAAGSGGLQIVDLCPDDANKLDPGICGCGVPDTDSDLDGVPDCLDLCPNNANYINPHPVCGCNPGGAGDTDGDGTPNCIDGCPTDPNKISPGICGCGRSDTLDSDGDGQIDCLDPCPFDSNYNTSNPPPNGICPDLCPDDPNKTAPGLCGCGVPDTDTDGDGVPNCIDPCPDHPNKEPGQCGCGVEEIDTDGDGWANCRDKCPVHDWKWDNEGECGCHVPPWEDIRDFPGDPTRGWPAFDLAVQDRDGDGYLNCHDVCPDNPNFTTDAGPCNCNNSCGTCGQARIDTDGDRCPCPAGVPNCELNNPGHPGHDPNVWWECDTCSNNPTRCSAGRCGCNFPGPRPCTNLAYDPENRFCPGGSNNYDIDGDGDGYFRCGDLCDTDDFRINEVGDTNKIHPGICGCGVEDEPDPDNPGQYRCNDMCPDDPNKDLPGICGCGVPDTDRDGDGDPDCIDPCPKDPNYNSGNLPPDADGDGIPDCVDLCPNDPNKAAPGLCGCGFSDDLDSDGDGIPDCIDPCPNHPFEEPGLCGCGIPDNDPTCICSSCQSAEQACINCKEQCATNANPQLCRAQNGCSGPCNHCCLLPPNYEICYPAGGCGGGG